METAYQNRTIGSCVSDDTYEQMLREAGRRGITVSELVRHYIEQGLNNPTPQELRRLYDRFSTMESALTELYSMAVVNWSQVKKEKVKPVLPWSPGALDAWKAQLSKKGLVNKKTGRTAYEDLTDRIADGFNVWDDEIADEEIQSILRDNWKADGTWSDEEEAEYQEKQKSKVEHLKEQVAAKAKKASPKIKPPTAKAAKPAARKIVKRKQNRF
jgi:hypothetical protein